MATIRKRSVTLTLADGGVASDDISVRGAGSTDRFSGLFGVRTTHDTASESFSVAVYPVEDIDGDDENTYGDRIFGISGPLSGKLYQPREESVDRDGDGTGEENAIPQISSESVYIDVDGGANGETVVVDLYIQTAGDQRF